MGKEIWKSLKGLVIAGDVYSVSSLGNIRNDKTKKRITLIREKVGYYRVNLNYKGTRKTYKVHRLVAIAFLETDTLDKFINHKDGIKTNNNVSNLEWCTPKENSVHAISTGLNNNYGENSPFAKLTEDEVVMIKKLLLDKVRVEEIASTYNISTDNINSIKLGYTWKQVQVEGFAPVKKSLTLSNEQVEDIRALYSSKEYTQKKLAEVYGVSRAYINMIIHNKKRSK